MAYYYKGKGLVREVFKSNAVIGTMTIESPGKFLAASQGLDAVSLINVRLGELPSATTNFIGGSTLVTAMNIPPSVTDVKGVFAPVFPNIEKVYLGNAENDNTLKDGLDTAYAGLTVDVYCDDGLVAGYQMKYASATNLTFIGVSNLVAYEIPFVSETTLTADYVRQIVGDLGVLNTAIEKIIVPPDFTSFDANAFSMIWALFPNCGEIEYYASEYAKIEYIESTGTQWIDTGVTLSSNITYTLDFSEHGVDSSSCIIGGNDWAGTFYHNGSFSLEACTSSQYFTFAGVSTNTRHIFAFNNQNPTIDGQSGSAGNFASAFSGTLTIFKGGVYPKLSTESLYSLKIFDNSVLVRDFIPCYRKSDNEIGLYDTVNGVFYTNQGTGVFLKGSDTGEDITIATTLTRPSVLTCTVVGSGTLTAQKVTDTIAKYPELASAEKVVVPPEFTEYGEDAISAVENAFPDATSYVYGLFRYNSWKDIQSVLESGDIPSSWDFSNEASVTKPVTLTNGETHNVFICDNTQNRYEFSTLGTYSKYVFKFKTFIMKSSRTNGASWSNDSLNTTVCNSTIYNLLPNDLKQYLKQVRISSCNHEANGSPSAAITYSDCYVFLPSNYEIFGSAGDSNTLEQSSQFSLYARNNNNNYRITYSLSGDVASVWLRSPCVGYDQYFCLVFTDGTNTYGYSGSTNFGVSPCFVLA